MADDVSIDYHLPLSGDGHVSLHIHARLAPLTGHDSGFILAVLDKITEFARVTAPGSVCQPEIPAVLRGVGAPGPGWTRPGGRQ